MTSHSGAVAGNVPNGGSVGSSGSPNVPVQLTSIVPVRVFDVHGEYFDTEVYLDSPMRILQLAIEDYFKVKPEVQLLMHNKQQIDPNRTLKQNGCLMLKGDPYVRISFIIKRGPVLNLVCQITSTREVFPLACAEDTTVWEVKRCLCEEITRRRESEPSPHRTPAPQHVRLLWRYMELNDKATLHYYRLPTNSVLTVMYKRGGAVAAAAGPVAVSRATAAAASPRTSASPTTAWRHGAPAAVVDPRVYAVDKVAAQPQQQPQHQHQQQVAPPPQPHLPPPRAPVEPMPAPTSYHPAVHHQQHQQQQQPAAAAAAPSLQPAGYPRVNEYAPVASPQVNELYATVRSLEVELQHLRAQMQRQQHDGRLFEAEWAQRCGERIAQLEGSVVRFHGYLQRALTLM